MHKLQLQLFIVTLVCILCIERAFSDVGAFRKKVQQEIVKGMAIANDDRAPIVYGEQGGRGDFKGQLDPVYWQKFGNYSFALKPGKRASAAIDSVFPTSRSQKEVKLECHSMMIAVIFRALKEAMGAERFDNQFRKTPLIIKYGDLKASGLERFFLKTQIPKGQIEVGDWVYFQNHDSYLHRHPDGPWQGENAIFVGKVRGENVFSGFGAPNKTERGMLKELLDRYNEPQSPEDKAILAAEWKKLEKWLVANSVYRKGSYFQLSQKLFKPIPARKDPEDIIEELFVPVARGLGYRSVAEFSSEFEYGVEEVNGMHLFWVEKTPSYEAKLDITDIPGMRRIDRLDYQKLYSLIFK